MTGPGCQRMLSVLRRKSADAPWVGLLAWKGKKWSGEFSDFSPVASPSPVERTEWSIEATRPHSQWRNRAGLAPDFPVMPDMGTKGKKTVTRDRSTFPVPGSRSASGSRNRKRGTRNEERGTGNGERGTTRRLSRTWTHRPDCATPSTHEINHAPECGSVHRAEVDPEAQPRW